MNPMPTPTDSTQSAIKRIFSLAELLNVGDPPPCSWDHWREAPPDPNHLQMGESTHTFSRLAGEKEIGSGNTVH